MRRRQGGRVDELAPAGAGLHRLVQRAAGHQLLPGQEPLRPAVGPGAAARAAGDRHRIPGHRHLVVHLGRGRRHVDAAVADVGEPLLADRPVRVVQVVAGPREPHRPGHLDVVPGADHVHRVPLLDGQVGPVRRVVAGPAGADRPAVDQVPVPVHLHVVGRGAGRHDQRPADGEGLGQGVIPVHARGGLHPVQVPGEADLGVRGPVGARPEGQAGRRGAAPVIPVPGAHDRLGRGDLQRVLDAGPEPLRDRAVELQQDRHADAVGLVVSLQDRGPERLRGGQRAERAGSGHLLAGAVGGGGGHRVVLGDVQRPLAAPHRAAMGQHPGDRVAVRGDRDMPDLAVPGPDRDALVRGGVPGAVARADGQLGGGRGGCGGRGRLMFARGGGRLAAA